MKHLNYLVIALLFLIGASESSAQQRGFGLGVVIGEPTGISMKWWRSSTRAIDAGLGWSISQNNTDFQQSRFHLHMDFVRHAYNAINSSERLPVYYGLGASVAGGSENESSLALRFVLGLAWQPARTPIDVFLELAPSLEVIPATNFYLNAGLGIRFFF
ncbi:MAG: hypothetical protein K9N35_12345 [Candidatus Marinimicrobia bacterium]|nr:hypothetical protein [Candidatus Neomarinimicrobiota bacterium]